MCILISPSSGQEALIQDYISKLFLHSTLIVDMVLDAMHLMRLCCSAPEKRADGDAGEVQGAI